MSSVQQDKKRFFGVHTQTHRHTHRDRERDRDREEKSAQTKIEVSWIFIPLRECECVCECVNTVGSCWLHHGVLVLGVLHVILFAFSSIFLFYVQMMGIPLH